MNKIFELKKAEQSVRNYFYNLYLHHDCCANETLNALTDYLIYILLKNDLDPADFTIRIHPVKEIEDGTVALLNYDEKHSNTFDLYLLKEKFRVHNFEEISNAFFAFVDAGHEFQHIVQYAISRDLVSDYDNSIMNLDSNMLDVLNLDTKQPKRYKHVENLFNRYETEIGKVSTIEKEADILSYEYLLELILNIINKEKDYVFADFMFQCYENLITDFKRRKRMIYDYIQQHEKTLKILKKRFKSSESLMPMP